MLSGKNDYCFFLVREIIPLTLILFPSSSSSKIIMIVLFSLLIFMNFRITLLYVTKNTYVFFYFGRFFIELRERLLWERTAIFRIFSPHLWTWYISLCLNLLYVVVWESSSHSLREIHCSSVCKWPWKALFPRVEEARSVYQYSHFPYIDLTVAFPSVCSLIASFSNFSHLWNSKCS